MSGHERIKARGARSEEKASSRFKVQRSRLKSRSEERGKGEFKVQSSTFKVEKQERGSRKT